MMAHIIICAECREKQSHWAKGLCRNCYQRNWARKNPAKIKARSRHYYQEHREELLAYQHNYRPPIIVCAECGNEGEQHAKGLCGPCYKHRWYEENRPEILAQRRIYRKNNRHKAIAWQACYEARKQALPSTLTGEQAEQKLLNLPCFYCGEETDLTLDHFVPVSRYGATTLANSVVACKSCNCKKYTKLPQEFIEQLALS